ncbi:MAG: agmatine deiminase family protein [Eubacteriales bacterium]
MPDTPTLYMPPEWREHERTLMEWPVLSSVVWKENYAATCKGYAETARAIAAFEPVTMLVNEDTQQAARSLCGEGVDILVIPHDDAWCRDNGPTFVYDADKRLHGINWRFNAWGGKYPDCKLDDEVAPKVLSHFGIPCVDADIVLEGGSIHVDGDGTLLTTRECLLNKNRNPDLSQEQIEDRLRRFLGIRHIIWLDNGLFGDETDGHIDNVACFAKPGTVLLQACHNPADPNFAITQSNLEVLRDARDAAGRRLEVVEIPHPPERFYRGERLTLSYLNFYLVNGGLILPVFGGDAQQTDTQARDVLQSVFPDRKIVTVDGMALITEGGNVHCITQQKPL